MARNDGGAAFPREDYQTDDPGLGQRGMSLRDYFAAQALTGITLNAEAHHWAPEGIAVRAYRIADAMLSASKKDTGE